MGHYDKTANQSVPRFTIGRDHHGWWVVKDRLDRVGGLFASEEAARHFAAEEADFDERQICLVEDDAELDLFSSPVSRNKSIGRLILENNRRIQKNRGQTPSSRPSAA